MLIFSFHSKNRWPSWVQKWCLKIYRSIYYREGFCQFWRFVPISNSIGLLDQNLLRYKAWLGNNYTSAGWATKNLLLQEPNPGSFLETSFLQISFRLIWANETHIFFKWQLLCMNYKVVYLACIKTLTGCPTTTVRAVENELKATGKQTFLTTNLLFENIRPIVP